MEYNLTKEQVKAVKAEITLRRQALKSMSTKVEGYLVDKSLDSYDFIELFGYEDVVECSEDVFNFEMSSSLTTLVNIMRDNIRVAELALNDAEKVLENLK